MEFRKPKQWFPLESNPEIMSEYIYRMGVGNTVQFHDVLGTEDWALEMVPRPVLGVLMLFPIKESTEIHREEENAKISAEGQILSPSCYYMKQTVGNACGTVGLLHCIANARSSLVIEPGSYTDRFLASTASMSPDERAQFLEADDEIEVTHEAAASEGQSEQIHEEVNTHFVCFT